MPRDKDFKRHVRRRMDQTGERYTQAREGLRGLDGIEWRVSGDQAAAYVHEVAEDGGRPVHALRCAGDPGSGFGGLQASVPAAEHRGRRVRFSVRLRTQDASGWAGAWLRADGPGNERLSFGSTQDRPVSGTTDWRPLAVVVEVPADADRLVMGTILRGRGAVRMAGPLLETVDADVPISFPYMAHGWLLGGDAPQAYRLTWEQDETPSGPASVAVLGSVTRQATGFGTMSRITAPTPHRGRRLRLAATLRGEAVERWAGLWMRVDDQQHRTLAFDNMEARRLTGTFAWTDASVVLDVPEEAKTVAYGLLLTGPGTVRAAAIRLEPVDERVPTTGTAWTDGWALAGSRADAFALGFEPDERAAGRRVAVLRSVADPGDGFGTLAQWLRFDGAPPPRVRLRATLEGTCERADGGAVLWVRLDGARGEPVAARGEPGLNSIVMRSAPPGASSGPGEQLAIVNAPDPPLRGAFDRLRVEAALDVPPEAVAVGFGVVVAGAGAVRISDLAMEADAGNGRWSPLAGARGLDAAPPA
ncbi:MAG TPA: hypothetical protein VIC57_12275 [Candidatus Dormibacteraeota bacterium]|jgi:uncharacterized protein with GYD domain